MYIYTCTLDAERGSSSSGGSVSDECSKIGECEEKGEGEGEGEKVASRKKARVMGPTLPPPSLRDMPDQVYVWEVTYTCTCTCVYIVHTCTNVCTCTCPYYIHVTIYIQKTNNKIIHLLMFLYY